MRNRKGTVRRNRPTTPSAIARRARELVGHLDRMMRVLVLAGGVDEPPVRIGRSEIAVLDTLGGEGAMAMGELATRVRVPVSTATRVVDRMVERDLVQRKRPADDRRTVLVALAGAGERFYEEALAARIAGTEQMLRSLTPAEQDQLLRLYRKMSDGLLSEPKPEQLR
jgi:DNA-binding MarR family transcriptional regulator